MSLHESTMYHHPSTHDIHHWLPYDDDSMSVPFTLFSLLGNHDHDVQAPSPQLPRLSLPEVNEDVDMNFSS